jgi:hypothetical protein
VGLPLVAPLIARKEYYLELLNRVRATLTIPLF